MSIDMVGWYEKSGALKVEGVGTIEKGKENMLALAQKNDIALRFKKFENEIFTATDTQGFAENGIATLAITTGTKSPYHKPEDDADLIDYKGLDKICGFLSDLSNSYATDPSFKPSGKVAAKHSSRRFRIGITAGIGSASINFPDAAFKTNTAFSYEAGLSAEFKFNKSLLLRADGLYETARSQFPVESNLYGAKGKFKQTAVCVPAYLILNNSTIGGFVGLGGFYRRVLDTEYSNKVTLPYAVDDNQYGLAFTFGISANYLDLSFNFRNNLKGMFADNTPKGKLSVFSFSLTRKF